MNLTAYTSATFTYFLRYTVFVCTSARVVTATSNLEMLATDQAALHDALQVSTSCPNWLFVPEPNQTTSTALPQHKMKKLLSLRPNIKKWKVSAYQGCAETSILGWVF